MRRRGEGVKGGERGSVERGSVERGSVGAWERGSVGAWERGAWSVEREA
jgi:hypothetical protein